jgi:deoxyxylulose-5-phosphate synthase
MQQPGNNFKTRRELPQIPRCFGLTVWTWLEKTKDNRNPPAMPSGSSLKFMMDAFPNVLLMWVLEQHAVTLAAGMARRRLLQHLLYFSTKLMTKLFMMWLYKIFQFFVWTELD